MGRRRSALAVVFWLAVLGMGAAARAEMPDEFAWLQAVPFRQDTPEVKGRVVTVFARKDETGKVVPTALVLGDWKKHCLAQRFTPEALRCTRFPAHVVNRDDGSVELWGSRHVQNLTIVDRAAMSPRPRGPRWIVKHQYDHVFRTYGAEPYEVVEESRQNQ